MEGNVLSGVVVAIIIQSMIFGSIFELLKALKAALIANEEVNSLLQRMCLCFIPVRENIHSSDVSTIFFKSSLE